MFLRKRRRATWLCDPAKTVPTLMATTHLISLNLKDLINAPKWMHLFCVSLKVFINSLLLLIYSIDYFKGLINMGDLVLVGGAVLSTRTANRVHADGWKVTVRDLENLKTSSIEWY